MVIWRSERILVFTSQQLKALTLNSESEASRPHSCCIGTGDLVHSRVISHCACDGYATHGHSHPAIVNGLVVLGPGEAVRCRKGIGSELKGVAEVCTFQDDSRISRSSVLQRI